MAKAKRKRQASSSGAVALIVRRGAKGRFRKLKEKTGQLPVKVVWDRRRNERRAVSEEVQSDRRNGDRRGDAPFTWDVSDFVVVDRPRRRR
jgi:hypothetical protein